VKVRWIKWWAFVICSSLAVAAMLFSVSRVGSVDERYQSYNVEMLEVTGGSHCGRTHMPFTQQLR